MTDQRTYIIPLRKECAHVPDYEKAKKAVKVTKAFLSKHMKVEKVALGRYLHKKLMEHGRKNPPHKVEVVVWKDGEKTKAELVGAPEEKEEVVEEKKGMGKKLAEKLTGKEESKPAEEAKAEVLKKPDTHKEKPPVEEKELSKKDQQKVAKKENFPKAEKPTHEKKK